MNKFIRFSLMATTALVLFACQFPPVPGGPPPASATAQASATPNSTGVAPIPISFAPGETTASRIGVINPNETVRYILSAAQGQILSINLTAPPNEIGMGVNGPTGLVLKATDTTLTWSATIATSGDHTINVVNLTNSSSTSYTLQVRLEPAP